jgi:putative nucleotidyltransferase with HDIG domain
MTILSRDRLVEAANALPPLPDTFVQLQMLFADPDYKMRDLVRAVELDSVLTGRAMKLANSAAYGLGNIDTTQQAVARLGAGAITALAVLASAQPPHDLNLRAFGLTPASYWSHSVAVLAFAEEMLARRIVTFGNTLLTAALIHDFGKLLMAPMLGQDQIDTIGRLEWQLPAVDQEMIALGINHAEVTAIIAQSWGLSERLVRAVEYHHNPGELEDPMCHALNIANQLAWQVEGYGHDLEREADACATSMSALQINGEQMELLLEAGSARLIDIQESYS